MQRPWSGNMPDALEELSGGSRGRSRVRGGRVGRKWDQRSSQGPDQAGQNKDLESFSKYNGKLGKAVRREAARSSLHSKGSPGLLLGEPALRRAEGKPQWKPLEDCVSWMGQLPGEQQCFYLLNNVWFLFWATDTKPKQISCSHSGSETAILYPLPGWGMWFTIVKIKLRHIKFVIG